MDSVPAREDLRWRAEGRRRDSVVRIDLNLRKLLNLRFAQFAKLTQNANFGSFDMQTRYSAPQNPPKQPYGNEVGGFKI